MIGEYAHADGAPAEGAWAAGTVTGVYAHADGGVVVVVVGGAWPSGTVMGEYVHAEGAMTQSALTAAVYCPAASPVNVWGLTPASPPWAPVVTLPFRRSTS